jgi:LPXTG-motif cell wall-anchored protein
MLDSYLTKIAAILAAFAGLVTYRVLPQTGNVSGAMTLGFAGLAASLVWVAANIIIEKLNLRVR